MKTEDHLMELVGGDWKLIDGQVEELEKKRILFFIMILEKQKSAN